MSWWFTIGLKAVRPAARQLAPTVRGLVQYGRPHGGNWRQDPLSRAPFPRDLHALVAKPFAAPAGVQAAANAKRFKKKKHGKNKDSGKAKPVSEDAEEDDEEDEDEDEDEDADEGGPEVEGFPYYVRISRKHMNKSLASLDRKFGTLSTSSGSPFAIFKDVKVAAFGAMVPMNSVAQFSTAGIRLIEIRVLDASLVKDVKIAIEKADLNLNPMVDETGTIRINLPKPTKELREKLHKVATTAAEECRAALRKERHVLFKVLQGYRREVSSADYRRFEKEAEQVYQQSLGDVKKALDGKLADIERL